MPQAETPVSRLPSAAQDEHAELAALRARRAELQAAREAREEAAAVKRLVEAERRAIQDEEALAAAVETYGEVGRHIEAVDTDLGVVIVKRASALRFKRFQDADTIDSKAASQLVRPCVVHPTLDVLDTMLDEQPGILLRLANAVSRLAGARANEVEKK